MFSTIFMGKIAHHKMSWEERIKCQNIAEDQFEMDYNYRNRGNGSWCYKYGIDNHSFGNLFYNVNKIFRNTIHSTSIRYGNTFFFPKRERFSYS